MGGRLKSDRYSRGGQDGWQAKEWLASRLRSRWVASRRVVGIHIKVDGRQKSVPIQAEFKEGCRQE